MNKKNSLSCEFVNCSDCKEGHNAMINYFHDESESRQILIKERTNESYRRTDEVWDALHNNQFNCIHSANLIDGQKIRTTKNAKAFAEILNDYEKIKISLRNESKQLCKEQEAIKNEIMAIEELERVIRGFNDCQKETFKIN